MKNFYKKIYSNYKFSVRNYDSNSKSLYWDRSIKKKTNLFHIKNLEYFRSNNLSENIDDYYLNKRFIRRMHSDLQNDCGKKFLEKFLTSKNIGNAKKIIKINNKFVTASDLFHIKYIHELNKKLNLKKINTVCEIGQGFGLLASKLLKIKDYKMILIDLPESNFISAFFLKKNFPQKKIIMDIDLDSKILTSASLKKGDIFIISPWIKLKDIEIDFYINSRSMMEMNLQSINKYFTFIHSNIKKNGYFLCINRYYKDLVGYPIEFHRYPFKDTWKKIISNSSWKQPHTHFLLVKKVTENKSDIKLTLLNIKKKYLEIVKKDKFFFRRWLPVDIYRFYKIVKNFIFKI